VPRACWQCERTDAGRLVSTSVEQQLTCQVATLAIPLHRARTPDLSYRKLIAVLHPCPDSVPGERRLSVRSATDTTQGHGVRAVKRAWRQGPSLRRYGAVEGGEPIVLSTALVSSPFRSLGWLCDAPSVACTRPRRAAPNKTETAAP
jgi:hypothetical protein